MGQVVSTRERFVVIRISAGDAECMGAKEYTGCEHYKVWDNNFGPTRDTDHYCDAYRTRLVFDGAARRCRECLESEAMLAGGGR